MECFRGDGQCNFVSSQRREHVYFQYVKRGMRWVFCPFSSDHLRDLLQAYTMICVCCVAFGANLLSYLIYKKEAKTKKQIEHTSQYGFM